jgi:transposase InsO family protein
MLNNRVQQLESQLQSQTSNRGVVSGASPKVSLPDKFTGTAGKCRGFLVSVENIFALQPQRYPTSEVKTRFIGTLLSNQALSWFTDVALNKTYLLDDYQLFVEEFRSLFEDPNIQRRAGSTLKKLSQGKGSVLAYSTVFRTNAVDSGYNERALIDMFRDGLNSEIKDTLAAHNVYFEELEPFIKYCNGLDRSIYDRKMEKNHFSPTVGGNYGRSARLGMSSRPQASYDRPMHSYGRPPRPPQSYPHSSSQSTPMDLDAVYTTDSKGFKHLTFEEKKRRKEMNLCLYCGESGHNYPSCPKKGTKRALNALQIASVRFMESLSEPSLFASIDMVIKGVDFNVKALIDSGANANFVSEEFVHSNGIKQLKLAEPIVVRMADGRTSAITQYLPLVTVKVYGKESTHDTAVDFLIVKGLKFSVIVGSPWLAKANPIIYWLEKTVEFMNPGDLIVKERSSNLPSTFNSSENYDSSKVYEECIEPGLEKEKDVTNTGDLIAKERSSNFYDSFKTSGVEVNILRVLPPGVPKNYMDYAEVFYDNEVTKLPPARAIDLSITLKNPDQKLPFLKIYNLSSKEELILKNWIDQNLKAGLIRKSTSPAAAPIFFVPKKDGTLRPCIDYRMLNENTVKDKFPLPLISDLSNKFSQSVVFTKLDLKGAYNLVRIKEGQENLCAFRSKFGQYEPLVVQFGLTNAPAVFQRFINSIFADLLDVYVVVYLDDILVFSSSQEDHIIHVKEVLSRLRDNQLVLKAEKCEWSVTEVEFLGFIISKDGMRMAKDKMLALKEFPSPINVKQVRSFLGLANFYRKFISNFSSIVTPLTRLTKKNVQFIWDQVCAESFENIKQAIAKDVVLKYPVVDRQFKLYCDASDYAIGSMLAQEDDDGVIRPLEFFSRKLDSAELNYSTYDKELLAIIDSLKNWRHYLVHSEKEILIFSDHNNLQYFRSSQLLKPRHARWAEFLAQFSYKILHISGKDNVVADVLSRQGTKKKNKDYHGILLDKVAFEDEDLPPLVINLLDCFLNVAEVHDYVEDIAKYLDSEANDWDCTEHPFSEYKSQIKKFSVIGDKVYYDRDKWKALYLPLGQREAAMIRCHDMLGHLGYDSVKDLLERRYFWPNMSEDFKAYINSCARCQRARGALPKAACLLPIPPVGHPFERWGIDFLQNLPITRSQNRHIITCIDYATRWVVAEAVPSMDSDVVIKFLYDRIFMQYGIPFEIVSDRGLSFMSEAVKQFLDMYSIKHLPSSSYHPQTNGMVESMHRMINHGITTAIDNDRSRWDEELAQVLFAIRVRTHSVTKYSPFTLVYGIEPRLFSDGEPPIQVRMPLDDDERRRMLLERTAEELENLGEIRGAAYKRSVAQAERMKGNEANESYIFKFQVNDWVKRRNFRKEKFQNNWSGPYYVVEHGFPGTYRLMKPDGSMVPNLVNESHLLPWTSREEEEEISRFQELDEPVNDSMLGADGFRDDNFQDYAPQEEDSDILVGVLDVLGVAPSTFSLYN